MYINYFTKFYVTIYMTERKKTPLHLFIGHSVYKKCKSREVLTSFNKVGISVSYNKVQRARNKLACFT